MLVLTRKKGERVMIGDDIVVTIIDVRGDGVRIGFDAPRGVSIQRAEVLAAVSAANTAAAKLGVSDGELLLGMLSSAGGGRAVDAPAAPPAGPSAPPAAAD
jgi:carbon storage regulator